MAKSLELIGRKFGKLTVIERIQNNKRGNSMWLCQCDCGKTKKALGYDLTHGRTVSCGCNPQGKISHRRNDLTGKKFNSLYVLGLYENRKGVLIWKCKCDCGNTVCVSGSNLKYGHTKTCGCNNGKHSNNFIDLTGKRFGRLVVLFEYEKIDKKIKWFCKCDCGNTVIAIGDNLRRNHIVSCGCKKKSEKINGESSERIYKEWYTMLRRCGKNYYQSKHYFDRNITVCKEWEEYKNFKEWAMSNGYDDKLTLDRIDNDKGYYPENCRWSTWKQQQNNKRNNRYITYNNKTQTLKEWSEELGLSYGMLKGRIQRGITVPDLFEPKHKNQYK